MKTALLLVRKTPFLHNLIIQWMCARVFVCVCVSVSVSVCRVVGGMLRGRGCDVNMITDVLYSVHLYIQFGV